MPIVPHGQPGIPGGMHGPGGGISARAALIFGCIVLVGALLVATLAERPIDGLMLGGFGLLMIAWSGLISGRGSPRLLLALGVAGGLLAFGAALILMLR